MPSTREPHPRQVSSRAQRASQSQHAVGGEGSVQTTNRPATRYQPLQATHQLLLDVYARAFRDLLQPNTIQETLEPTLQQIKQHLYDRDFKTAFGNTNALRAYSARWSPTRALCYADVFTGVYHDHLLGKQRLSCLCIGGGGGAELVGFAGLLHSFSSSTQPSSVSKDLPQSISLSIADIADWSTAIEELQDALRLDGLDAGCLSLFACMQNDLLAPSTLRNGPITQTVSSADLVTICFTLNELFSESLSKTQALLLDLTNTVKNDAVLLIVDSAGSYSSVSLGKKHEGDSRAVAASESTSPENVRKYPMAWLLDHILLKVAPQLDSSAKPPWRKLQTCDSRWFRLSDRLNYPIGLEDMRYQMHVFRRI